MSKRIIIYGGEMAGVCAVLKSVENAPAGTSVTIIYPYVSKKPGGLATVGGLNCCDSASPLENEDRNLIRNPTIINIIYKTKIMCYNSIV